MHHGVTNLYWIIRGHDDLPIVAIVIPGAVPASGRGSLCSNYLFQPFSALYTLSIQHGVVGDDLEKVTGSSTMTTTCPQPLSTLETCLPQTLLCNTLLQHCSTTRLSHSTHTHTLQNRNPRSTPNQSHGADGEPWQKLLLYQKHIKNACQAESGIPRPPKTRWKREQREQCSSWVSRYRTNTSNATCQTHLSLRVTLAANLLTTSWHILMRIHLLVWKRLEKASTFLRSVHLPQRQHPHSLAVSNLNSMRYSRT